MTCNVDDCTRPVKALALCETHYMRQRRHGHPGNAPIASPGRGLAARFWAKVDRRGPDECWEWTAARNESGYGVMRPEGKRTGPTVKAHRVALALSGVDVDGYVVRHRCDNPPCVNPAHLELGSPLDNVADMVERGRVAKGSQLSRLSEADVGTIRSLAAGGMLHRVIAERFGVSRSAVTRIVNRRGWLHVA